MGRLPVDGGAAVSCWMERRRESPLAASERGKEGGFYKIAREKIAAFTGEMAKRTKNGKHLHQNIENRREIK